MPKEITHWHIASRVESLLLSRPGTDADETRAVESIRRWPGMFYLGAVVYDSPFYAMLMPDSGRFSAAASALHGVHGEDTFEPYRRIVAQNDFGAPSPLLACMAGALTHYAADVTMHPLVSYFCNGSETSELRHRAFETCLDLFTVAGAGVPERVASGMKRLIAAPELIQVARALVPFYTPDESIHHSEVERVIHRHAWIRDRFDAAVWKRLLRLYGHVAGPSGEVLAATWYPPRSEGTAALEPLRGFFSRPIDYRHPRTGESRSLSAEGHFALTAELACKLIRAFERGSLGSDGPGLSLDAGCDIHRYPEERYTGFASPIARASRYYR